MTSEAIHPDYFADADARVYTTDPNRPASARTFVWANARWYEREEGVIGTGAVDFSPVADSDEELRTWLRESDLDVDELDAGDFYVMVLEEFVNQTPPLHQSPERSDQTLEQQTAPWRPR